MGTTKFEKRNIAVDIPAWEPSLCIQCGTCSLVCPHGTIRLKAYDKKYLDKAPKTFKSAEAKGKEFAGLSATIQVAAEDCTGCGVCVQMCPVQEKDANKQPTGRKAINMSPQEPLRLQERENFKYFLSIPNTDAKLFKRESVKGSQLIMPLFEYSGACAGCGETPYVKLLTQLFGDRAMIGNATGCSSIYGGNLPTTPYTTREDGRGPIWSNSLFEDNAEFSLGMRLTVDKFKQQAVELVDAVAKKGCIDAAFAGEITAAVVANDPSQDAIEIQRGRVAKLKEQCKKSDCAECKRLLTMADYLVRKSVWALGGDGWAYDIGYGGLDHVLANGADINGLLEYRRADVEIDASRSGCEIRGGRKDGAEKGYGPFGDDLRQYLRRQNSVGRQHQSGGKGIYRGRGVPGTIVDNRLCPVYQSRHRYDDRVRRAEESRGLRALAFVSF
jgi:pyruvate-ferredoxin/flavodoxin oxidoreductase